MKRTTIHLPADQHIVPTTILPADLGGLMRRKVLKCRSLPHCRAARGCDARARLASQRPCASTVPGQADPSDRALSAGLRHGHHQDACWGQELSTAWNQPVIVDNRPGASTIIGTEIVAHSAPDGYTMVMASNNHAINPALFAGKLPFDSQKDFAAVAEVAILPFVALVNPQLSVKTFGELLALARSKPHELTYASTGNGTPAACGRRDAEARSEHRSDPHSLQRQRVGRGRRRLGSGLDDVHQRALGHKPGSCGQASRVGRRHIEADRHDAGGANHIRAGFPRIRREPMDGASRSGTHARRHRRQTRAGNCSRSQ